MKTRILCLLTALCIILSILPVSAEEVPVITILTQPASHTTVTRGEVSVKLYVNASVSDGSELSYQWYESTFYDSNKYGVEIPGATSAEFAIPADISVSKDYFCEVRANGAEPVRTNVAMVTVKEPAPVITITKQPERQTTVYQKNKLVKAELSCEASVTGFGLARYQWYSSTTDSNTKGTPVTSSSTTGTFQLPSELKVGTYYYFCEVTAKGAETVRSEVAVVVVEPERASIIIHGQPEKTVPLIMGKIDVRTLSVVARASTNAEVSYQWYSNTVNYNYSGTPIAGATKSSYKIPSDLQAGTYYYYCKLSAVGAEPVCTDVTTITVRALESRNAPPAPTLESKAPDSISVVYNNIDLEFSMDGKKWGGPVFKGLTPYTTYKIYARYKETNTHYMSPISEPLVVRTPKRYVDKGDQKAPSAPQVLSKTGRSVTLKPIQGAEYSKDGYTWQDNNTFYNLSLSTTYKFWARMKETDELKESSKSSPTAVTTEASGGFPFVPSDKNMTNGLIKSGWAYIMNRDYSYMAPDEIGFVWPTREPTPYYFEHLGNNTYYIRTTNGGYLSYLGKAREMAQVIISNKPCEWKVYSYAESGYVEYNLCVASDPSCILRFWHYCWEYIDTHVTLSKFSANRFLWEGAEVTVSTLMVEAALPQWWKDYKSGKTEPTYKVVETTTFDASKSDKPTDSIGSVTKKTSIPKELSHTTQEEWDAIQLTNIARARDGLPLLVTFSKMQEMSGVRSDELARDFKDGHTRLDGTSYSTVFSQYGFSPTVHGENSHLATGGADSAEHAIDSWLYSDGHRRNIKTSSFTYIGIGHRFKDSMGNWEQLFASSKDSECVSIEYDAEKGYFTLKLKNGITAYAPYDEKSSPKKDGKVTFVYPGVSTAKSSTVNTAASKVTGQGGQAVIQPGEPCGPAVGSTDKGDAVWLQLNEKNSLHLLLR